MTKKSSNPHASLSNRSWIEPDSGQGGEELRSLCNSLDVSEAMGKILASRQLADAEEAQRYLHPSEDQLHSALLMLDMEPTVERIKAALENYEKILIFGDYDVDGTAAAAILYNYLKRLGARAHYFIPHRITDGYGLSPESVAKFKDWKVQLLITVDIGSTEVEGARLLAEAGIDLIITDHHRLGSEKPNSLSMLNPQQQDCSYPFKELSAAGVAYKLVCGLDQLLGEQQYFVRRGIPRTAPSYYLDLVALATVADMTPLIGENRILVKLGLDAINDNPRPGLSGLIKECNIRGDISPSSISFKLAPKINALGRVGEPRLGVQLFTSHSYTESRRLARFMMEINRERKQIEDKVFAGALEQISATEADPGCVLVGEDWHPGVIGSVATRVAYQIQKPTVVLTMHQKPLATGSARSWRGFNVLEILKICEGLLERYGGHPCAAGLSLNPDNLGAFRAEFNRAVEQENTENPCTYFSDLKIDAWVTPDMLNSRLVKEISGLSPFGHCNPEPVLAMKGISVTEMERYQNRHLKFLLHCPDGLQLEAIAWDRSDWDMKKSQQYDFAFMPQTGNGSGNSKTRLKIVDCIPSG